MKIFDNIQEDKSWSFEESSRKDTSYASHGYHRYPAKFIPQLARRCILENSERGDLIVDPFCGCGTTIIESLIQGRKSMGIDINPVAILISKAKITPLEPNKLNETKEKIFHLIENYQKPKRTILTKELYIGFQKKI